LASAIKTVCLGKKRFAALGVAELRRLRTLQEEHKKRVCRLYSEEGPGISRRKPRRRKSVEVRETRPPTGQPKESGSMDFMSDQLVGGTP